ncbi:hypothetical protein BFW01_g6019 [Lasiodiplodia theobromae]|nr:hypothetical protein BFW01_g6019 [Lasiodiplodia theobromae]
MAPIKVAILGATGETGGSIVDGLLESSTPFEVTALIRPASLTKPKTLDLQNRGVTIIPYDTSANAQQDDEQAIKTLRGIDVVIAAVGPDGMDAQLALATAAKAAGVQRFVPSFFATAAPPRGVVDVRGKKEDVLDHVKKLGLGYTVIDIGWWMHGFVPALPSGRTEYVRVEILTMKGGPNILPGNGDVPTAVTATEDVGRFVARVIVDERTLNKMVFVYGEVVTPNQAYELMERLSGEKIERRYLDGPEIMAEIPDVKEALANGSADMLAILKHHVLQYYYSIGVRRDNNPEYAEYLGYLDGKKLYPDLKGVSLEEFFQSILDGKAKRPYTNHS